MLGAGDEVGEGVLLLQQLAVLVPLPPHLLSAADVRHGIHEAAIQQADAQRVEARVHAVAVRTVPVKQQRVRSVLPETLAVDQRDRHADAVLRGGVDPLRLVVGRIESPQHLFALEQLLLAGDHVVVVDRRRRGHRGVVVAHQRRVEVEVHGREGGVGRLAEVHVVFLRPRPGPDAELHQPRLPLSHYQVILEDLEILQQDVVPVREYLSPVPDRRASHRGLHQPEVLRVAVGPDVEVAAGVIDGVLVIPLARQEDPECSPRRVGVQVAVLAAQRLGGGDHEVLLGLGLEDETPEGGILLFVDQPVVGRVGAQHVPVDAVRAERHRVLLGVEDRLVVVGPGHVAGDVGDHVAEQLAGGQDLEGDRIESPPDRVHAVSGQVLSGADLRHAHRAVLVPLGHLVDIDHDLLGRLQRALLAAEDRVLLALFDARVVVVIVPLVRRRHVGLLDARLELVKQRLFERLGMGRHCGRVLVLRLEVLDDLGIVALAEPVIVVGADVAVLFELPRHDFGTRRLDLRNVALAAGHAKVQAGQQHNHQTGH